jgi:hypothetical protein
METRRGRGHSRDLDVTAIYKTGFKNKCKGVNWTHLSQDRVQWRALLIMVMNHGVPLKSEKILTS